jgi:hypothetical protein
MFAEFGSDQTVVLSVGGTLTQSVIEDSSVRSAMNMGAADRLVLDPISLSAYNKIAHAKERIMLAGSAQEATGAHLRTQWTSSAVVSLEASRFLSGKTAPARPRAGSPCSPDHRGLRMRVQLVRCYKLVPTRTMSRHVRCAVNRSVACRLFKQSRQVIRFKSLSLAPLSTTTCIVRT